MENEFTYSSVYPNIDKQVVRATRQLIKRGILKQGVPGEEKSWALGEWLREVSAFYNVPCPDLILLTEATNDNLMEKMAGRIMKMFTGGGMYSATNDGRHVISLYYNISLTTFLHEFRHHMQHIMPAGELNPYHGNAESDYDKNEEDARAWSLSLFKLAAPKMYANAVEKKLLYYH